MEVDRKIIVRRIISLVTDFKNSWKDLPQDGWPHARLCVQRGPGVPNGMAAADCRAPGPGAIMREDLQDGGV